MTAVPLHVRATLKDLCSSEEGKEECTDFVGNEAKGIFLKERHRVK